MKRITMPKLLFLIAYGLYIARAGIESTTFMSFFSNYSITRPITFFLGVILIGIKILFYDKKFDKKAIRYVLIITVIFLVEFYYTSYFELLYLSLLMIGSKKIEIKDVVKLHFGVYLSITIAAALASGIGLIENYTTISSSGVSRAAWGNTYPTDFAAGIFYLLLDYAYLNYKRMNVLRYMGMLLIVILSFEVTHSQTSLILGVFLLTLLMLSRSKKIANVLSSDLYKNIIAWSFPAIAVITIYAQYIFKNNGYNSPILLWLNVLMNYRLGFGSLAIQKYGLSLFGKRIEFYGAGWGTNNSETYFYVDNAYLQYALLYGLLLTAIFTLGYYLLSRYSGYIDNEIKMIIVLSCISLSAITEPRIFNILYNPFFLGLGIMLWKYRSIAKGMRKANRPIKRLKI